MAEHGIDPGEATGLEVAVVGMAGRFPGAPDIHAFWRNLRDGVESIRFFSRAELAAAGTDPELLDHPDFVPARGELAGADEFDAGLFHLTPRDAEILDPQHRVLLECAWAALEHAGYDPARVDRPVGVFAGCSTSGYLANLAASPELMRSVGTTRLLLGNEKDHLAAGISYRLNLRGPSLAVQTACSTSMVAVHLACQSLLAGECDMALAGGAGIGVPLRTGYLYVPEGIASPDGHCRAFDAEARGTVGGSGAGMVALRRLEDALADGDTIHAVIRGSAVNNDGAQKVGYTAPSVTGQARVLSEALAAAQVDPSTIHYLEAHGSGTPLGDAIELKAVGQVLAGVEGHRWAIGSVKTNVGHLDAAAGITGFIKTVMSLKHQQIPPSLHCTVPHPEIAASGGRVFVNTELRPWERNGTPRRAGVSSFGIGGTNAHVILEEAPVPAPSGPSRALQLLVLSARTPEAAAAAARNLAAHLEAESPGLADAAFTLQTGRREMEHRLAVVCADAAEGAAALREAAAGGAARVQAERPAAFLFPGLGMHHVDMARGLYDAEPAFRDAVDECCELLLPVLGSDLRAVMYGPAGDDGPASGGWNLRAMLGRDAAPAPSALDDTRLAQPAVFVTEYALARLWMSWGVEPRALLGHSLGEYVAACVAGVLRVEDALRLVALRARLIDALPEGAMLAVPLGEAELRALLPAGVDVAAVNTPESCVAAGPVEAIQALEAVLAERGTVSRRLTTRHAFHSRAMTAVAAELERLVEGFELAAPRIPIVSNVTGTWMTEAEARSPGYWARHLCQTVRFADGVATLRAEPGWVMLEVGPGQTLGAWAMQHPTGDAGAHTAFSSLRHPHNRVDDLRFLLDTLGGLWCAGVRVDWPAFSAGESRRRVPLPGYPFERRRYFVDAPRPAAPLPDQAELEQGGTPAPDAHHGKEPDMMDNGRAAQASPRRRDILQRLREISAELTGIGADQVETGVDFFRAGFDSLLLLQGIQAIEKRVGVRVSLVELLEEIVTLDALAEHIDRALAPDVVVHVDRPAVPEPVIAEAVAQALAAEGVVPEAAAPVPAEPPRTIAAPPAFYPAPGSQRGWAENAGALERLVERQMEMMREQNERVIAQQMELARQQSELMSRHIAAFLGGVIPTIEPAPRAPADGAAANGSAHAASPLGGPASPVVAGGSANGSASAETASSYGSPSTLVAGSPNRSSTSLHGSINGGSSTPDAGFVNGVSSTETVGFVNGGASAGVHGLTNGGASAVIGGSANGGGSTVVAELRGGAVEPGRARIRPETFVAYQPLNTDPAGLNPVQREYLDGFIDRYVARTGASKAHQARFHRALADSRVTARFRRALKEILYPIVGTGGRGSRLRDLDGNEYVDIAMGFGCNLFGHAPDFVTRAVHEQAERGYALGPQSEDAGYAAELVCRLGGVDRAVFCNSGTEAVLGAVRAARTYTGRTKVAMFAGSYHGWSDLVLGRLFTAGGRREVRPSAPGVPPLPLGDVLMLDFDDPASLELLAEQLDQIALVMVEPVQSRRPDLQPFAFLRQLRRMTQDAGVLLLFDELITGFRMGTGGAQSFFGVKADLVTYGKVVAGGLPMGVVGGTEEVMSVFDGGMWNYGDDSYPTGQRTLFAGAYFKHPVSMAVARAILTEVERRGQPMYDELNARTTALVERINAFLEAGRYPITAAHFSSCFRFFFGPEVVFPDLFNHHLIAEGIYVLPETGTHFLSPAHTDEDLEAVYRAICTTLRDMRRGGFIPPGPDGGEDDDGPESGGPSAPGLAVRGLPVDGNAADEVRVLPLTEGQRQLWFESQMGDDAALAYVESTAVRLRGPLNVDALRAALDAVSARHDTLRMTFSADGEAQLIHPPRPLQVPWADFRAVPADERDERVRAWLRGLAREPFRLAEGPLVRFALAAVEADEHLLVITAHHAAVDGWSFGVVWSDLSAMYAAAREGRRAELPAPADHGAAVRAQVEAVSSDEEAEAYWLARFADGVPVLDLPTDRPRPPVRGYAGERVERVMGGRLMHRLADAGRPHGLTLFNTLLSAYFVWLSRLSGQDDIVVGTPAAGQAGRAGAAELVGYGINVLPVRARVDANASFADNARAVRRALLGALEHQGFSFPRLVEKLLRTRDPSRPPVFSAMLNLDREPETTLLGDVPASFEPNFAGGAKVDIRFALTETGDQLVLRCDFAAELFDAATIAGWLAGFERLLEQVAAGPGTRVSEMALVGGDDRRRVLRDWNRTDAPRAETCLHRLFEAQAARTPDAAAVLFGERTVTYAELDRAANRVAHALLRRGTGVETRVAVLMDNGPEAVAALLGVMKAGAAYVPLDAASPADRLRYVLADSGAALVLTDGSAPLPADAPPSVHAGPGALDGERDDAPAAAVHPRGLAYVIYTSGSTGRPKGVGVEHRSVCNTILNYIHEYEVHPAARVLSFAPLHFDASGTDLYTALCSGAAVVTAPREALVPGPELVALLEGQRVTHAKFTPSALAALPSAPLPALEAVMTGGEACTAELVAHWAPGRRFYNGYGPTEASIRVTVARCTDGTRIPPLGRPTDNVRLYVLDPFGHPLPPGVPGELCIGGVQVARGYLGRPALTAEKFIPDPFGPEPGGRLYRSGDRVRHRVDGELEFLGRTDFQVKIRGYRIETGEVEAALREFPGVRDAIVVAREDAPGDRRLVGYAAVEGEAPSPRAVRDALRERLPEYMVPSAFVFLDRLPMSGTGKVDRAALPAPEQAPADAGWTAPRTPVEEALAGIWGTVLGVERVGAHDDFFELGGHSLLATRVVSRVREVFGVEARLRALFEAPTVAGLAARIEALRRAGVPAPPAIAPADRSRPLPLSFAQERLWFLDRMPEGAAYVIPQGMRLAGALDIPALERALGEVMRRHEVLRTVFREGDEGPVQVITPFNGFTLPVEDLSRATPAEREAVVERRAAESVARPFDLAAGPLFRASLLRLAEDDHALLLSVHHAVADGWSMAVLDTELGALYEAFRRGDPSPLPEPPVQYADYAAWQRTHLRGEALDRELGWWKERLAGAPALLELPADHPRPAVMAFRGGFELVHYPAELLDRLQALARREGATLYMVLLGAFQALLARYAGTDDVVVGTTTAGRTRAELEPLIGLFMNTLALRTDLSGDPSFRELLRRVRDVTLGAYEHQDLPFEKLVAELRPERSLSHTPVFQVLFELHNTGAGEAGLPGLQAQTLGADVVGLKCDLSVALTAGADGLRGALLYSTELFEPTTARRMVGHLERVLEQVAEDAEVVLSRLRLTGPEERARMAEWNRTAAPYPAERCIHQLFQEQTRRTPDAVAVQWDEGSMTFGELDARAELLARRLAARGVGPEVRVGICLRRSPELLAGILGVMKAGGAWVPVDPGHPAERIAYVLHDSGAALVLAQDALAEVLAPVGLPVIRLDAEWERIAAETVDGLTADRAAVDSGVTAENLAYVIYTSGSTGRPKGVAMHHRGVVNYIHWGIRHYGADRGAGAPVFTSMAVDLTITNLLPLFAGRPVRLLPEESPVEALAQLLRSGPEFGLIKITPIHLGLLDGMLRPEELAACAHTLVVGADFLSAGPTVIWQDHAPGVRVMNEYGPTETVVGCSAYTLPPGRHRSGPVPVGRAIDNLTFHVLDAHGEQVPAGLPGELYIGGAGVARGYLGRPALSAEKFVPDPFAGPGDRMYRTGDRARWLPEGDLLILGRTDHQLKIRGYRVEPGEIEAALRRCDGVRECLVVAREDRPGDRRLVAYVVGDAEAAALGDQLRRTLPEYMVPGAFVRLDALPQTRTGKLDPRTLPAPVWSAARAEDEAPRNEVEAELAAMWAELLGIEDVGVTRSFFELGGDSFLALRLFTRANRQLGCDLPVSTLFAGATVRHMADAVLRQRDSVSALPESIVPLQPGGSLPPLFFIHSADRNVMGYVNLVRHLGPEQPAWGVRDLGDLSRPVAQIAAEHVQAIRAVQPHGPYALVGWSFGGVVAYEIAVRLEGMGERVAFVGLMDTMSPLLMREWSWARDAEVVAGMAHEAAEQNGGALALTPDDLEGVEVEEMIRRAAAALRTQGAVPAEFDDESLAEAVRNVRGRIASGSTYTPERFSGTVTLFRASAGSERQERFFAERAEEERRTLGWTPLADAVRVHAVPGTHVTLGAEPHVRTLARHMRESLAAARSHAAPAGDA
ncbi:non-ribosomal peptide synthetase/type I polyketide synthase [Longimicrobium terrae]|uniref:Phenolphthiocerol/phthiocerol polyketide synthase subunit E n=1 Tax=Longimicrobium terrae TaxID=1639882 RepID=A0A841GQT5_9BACT|nr:non-ribosomal peptide synthetase/type I polyketide synthase [Longimicrobium terrae]MBB4635036.1 amino acid adenylation domain-containing protein [Longimicrobium terrae]MBB6069430.1 amino acid adenylation domain-containing protein [Longimicrobium terrae]NNC31765.1 amino acid adenylation domain-containing protein [Longimicrobium terrae]